MVYQFLFLEEMTFTQEEYRYPIAELKKGKVNRTNLNLVFKNDNFQFTGILSDKWSMGDILNQFLITRPI